MPEKIVLARKLKAYRSSLRKSQPEMAAEIGISPETLCSIERELGNPTLETMQKIAAHMGESVSALLEVGLNREDNFRRAYDLLYRLGATANYVGFGHTAYAVVLCAEQPERLSLVTKRLYPEVAKEYGTNWKTVERNIRTIGRMIWQESRPLLEELAHKPLERKLRTAQFLAILASALNTEY